MSAPSRRSTSQIKDRTGERHGLLTVIRRVTSAPGIVWLCRCDCGRWPEFTSEQLHHRRSCGCLKVEAGLLREARRAAR